MTPSLERMFKFMELLNKLREIERTLYVPGTERLENDVEHSYQLAMLAWYIIDSERLSLDKDKVIRYALAHDLVEIFAGDTYLYSEDQELVASKLDREKEAQKKLKEVLAEFPDLQEAIEAYMTKKDPESRFVYVLDKMDPEFKIFLDKGKSWKDRQVRFSMVWEKKKEKGHLSPELEKHYYDLLQLLKDNEDKLFWQGEDEMRDHLGIE